jgi:hypothetical protein
VRTQATDEEFEKRLEESRRGKGIAQSNQLTQLQLPLTLESISHAVRLTAAFPSSNDLVPHNAIAPITKAGTTKLTIALTTVVMYSARYGWLCFMPHALFSTPLYKGK